MSPTPDNVITRESPVEPSAPQRLEDLAEIIRAYNQATQSLEQSHEALRNQVVRLQRELASSNAQLQRSRRLAALGEMAAGIAHEIRNPLAAIQLYAGLIASDLQGHAQFVQADDHARKIQSAVRGLDAVVGDVLNFSREFKPRIQPHDAYVMFDRVVGTLRPMLENTGVEVRLLRCDKPVPVQADADMLQQALVNLIRNAVDAMPQGGTLTLSATQEPEEGLTRLVVADSGPGIDQQAIDRIFNPFFTTRNTGTGLGLAIVHRIVDNHGGAISVHNDHGAVFELRLPWQPADDAAQPGED